MNATMARLCIRESLNSPAEGSAKRNQTVLDAEFLGCERCAACASAFERSFRPRSTHSGPLIFRKGTFDAAELRPRARAR